MTFEYFDIPFRYNETSIKLLFQNPYTLFVFWDICDADEKAFIEKYGEDSYYNSRIYLKITNISNGQVFEVDINPFAKSWYIPIHDANCKYKAELCRRINNNELSITSSNILTLPADSPNFNISDNVKFINVKTHETAFVLSRKEAIKCINKAHSDIELVETELEENKLQNKHSLQYILKNPGSINNVGSGSRYNK